MVRFEPNEGHITVCGCSVIVSMQSQFSVEVLRVLQVTHNQLNVLDLSWLNDGAEMAQGDLDPLSRNMAVSLRQLIEQRDKANEVLRHRMHAGPLEHACYWRVRERDHFHAGCMDRH